MAATVDRVGMAAEAAVMEVRVRRGVEAVAVEAWAGMVAMVVMTVAMDMTAARGVAMEVMEATAVLEVMEVAAGSEAVGEAKVAKAAIRALEERWGVVSWGGGGTGAQRGGGGLAVWGCGRRVRRATHMMARPASLTCVFIASWLALRALHARIV